MDAWVQIKAYMGIQLLHVNIYDTITNFRVSIMMMGKFYNPLNQDRTTSEISVNTGSGNDWLPDGTKPLPESMLTYHQ